MRLAHLSTYFFGRSVSKIKFAHEQQMTRLMRSNSRRKSLGFSERIFSFRSKQRMSRRRANGFSYTEREGRKHSTAVSFVFILSLPFRTNTTWREKNLSDTLLLLGCWPPTCAILKRRLRNSGLDYATFTDLSTATLVTSHDELT